jgi:hypothetical protein
MRMLIRAGEILSGPLALVLRVVGFVPGRSDLVSAERIDQPVRLDGSGTRLWERSRSGLRFTAKLSD